MAKLTASMNFRLILTIACFGVGLMLVLVSVFEYFNPGANTGRLPSAISLGAAGWFALGATIAPRKS